MTQPVIINPGARNTFVGTSKAYKLDIVWRNVIIMSLIHIGGIYGLFLVPSAKYQTSLFTIVWGYMAAFGITAGAHRLWAHRSYKAKWPLRLLLTIFQTMAFQNHTYEWVRDHRVHHKYSETDADPHNAKRGFFFSHVGWLLVRKHNDVKIKGQTVDMSDLEADPFVMFQKRNYLRIVFLLCFIIPAMIPIYCWDETPKIAIFATLLRYILTLNFTWLVNSAAHIWGNKPYDKNIGPTTNKAVAILASGEGWHNYHHVFPSDYKTSELGSYSMNFTTAIIDFFAYIGWAYDLKTTSEDVIVQRAMRTGDGTRHLEIGSSY